MVFIGYLVFALIAVVMALSGFFGFMESSTVFTQQASAIVGCAGFLGLLLCCVGDGIRRLTAVLQKLAEGLDADSRFLRRTFDTHSADPVMPAPPPVPARPARR